MGFQLRYLPQSAHSTFSKQYKNAVHLCEDGNLLEGLNLTYSSLEMLVQRLYGDWLQREKQYELYQGLSAYHPVAPQKVYALFAQVRELLLFQLPLTEIEGLEEGADLSSLLNEYALPTFSKKDLMTALKEENPQHKKDSTLVLHNIQRFSPLSLRFLTLAEILGFEVLFVVHLPTLSLHWESLYAPFPRIQMEKYPIDSGEISPPTVPNESQKKRERKTPSRRYLWLTGFLYPLFASWKKESTIFMVDFTHLTNCFNVPWGGNPSPMKLLRSLYQMEVLFHSPLPYEEFIQTRRDPFLYSRSEHPQEEPVPFSLLGLYHKKSLPLEEIQLVFHEIDQLQQLAVALFSSLGEEMEQRFRNLHLFYEKKEWDLLHWEEELFLERLTQVDDLPLHFGEEVESLRREVASFQTMEPVINFRGEASPLLSLYRAVASTELFLPTSWEEEGFADFVLRSPTETSPPYQYTRFQGMSFVLCPYRFFWEYLLQDAPLIQEREDYVKFYENAMIMVTWQQFSEKTVQIVEWTGWMDEVDKHYSPSLPFLSKGERLDALHRAKAYIKKSILATPTQIRKFAPTHSQMKWRFGEASFLSPQHPYSSGMKFRNKQHLSLHKLPKDDDIHSPYRVELETDIQNYINSTQDSPLRGSPCDSCPQRHHCGVEKSLYD